MHPVNRLPNSSRVYYATAVEVMAEKKKKKKIRPSTKPYRYQFAQMHT